MTSHLDHPLVRRYLDELESLLGGLDAVERSEIVTGVREHLADLLVDPHDDDEVRAVLGELGPAAAVADEAYAGRPTPRPSAAAPMLLAPVPVSSRAWLPWTVVVLLGLAVLLALGAMGGMGGTTTSGSVTSRSEVSPVGGAGPVSRTRDEEVVISVQDFDAAGTLAAAAGGMVAALPLWLPLVVLVGTTALWRRGEKALMVVLVPLALVLVAAVPIVGVAVLGRGAAGPGGAVGFAGALLLVLAVAVVMVRRALRRAEAKQPRLVAQPLPS